MEAAQARQCAEGGGEALEEGASLCAEMYSDVGEVRGEVEVIKAFRSHVQAAQLTPPQLQAERATYSSFP
jgi:hypothetical protein